MYRYGGAIAASLILGGLIGTASAEGPLRLKMSWQQKDVEFPMFSPDGKLFVMSGEGGTSLRETRTGKVRFTLTPGPEPLHAAGFSPDGRLFLAQVSSDRHKPVIVFDLKVWDVETGEVRGLFPHVSERVIATTGGHYFSVDGSLLVFTENTDRLPVVVQTAKARIDDRFDVEFTYNASKGWPCVKVWDVARWKELGVLDAGTNMVFSPEGKTLVTGTRDWNSPVTKFWDARTLELKAEHVGQIPWPIGFSPDGKYVVDGGYKERTLWAMATGEKWPLPVKLHPSNAPVFTPNGALVFPNGLPRGYPSHNMNQEFPCYDISTLPPRPVDLGPGQLVEQPLTYKEPRLLVSPASMRYASFGAADEKDQRTVVLRDLSTRKDLGTYRITGLIDSSFSPDGRWLSVLTGQYVATPQSSDGRYEKQLRLLDPATGQVAAEVPLPVEVWGDPKWQFSPDGSTLVVVYTPGTNADPGINDRPKTVVFWEVAPRPK